MRRLLPVLVVSLALVPAAHGHHRQTPEIVAITTAGDATLPRLAPASRKAAAVVVDASIAVVRPFQDPAAPAFAFATDANANPSISSNGRIVAWDTDADPLGGAAPAPQVVEQNGFDLQQIVAHPSDPTTNPALDLTGFWVAFESTSDLVGKNGARARQVFLRSLDGSFTQLSRGAGASANASIARKGVLAVFDSTSDPKTGNDTGIAQVWLSTPSADSADPITSGAGPSTSPSFSNDGRLVVFQSRADLAGDGHDTNTWQVFAYDTLSKTFARITNDGGGCTGPTSARIMRDWRVAYVCNGTAYFTMLRSNERFAVATIGGDTTRIVPQADVHFLLVATTADLLAGAGTTNGHRVYMVNLYKRPPDTVASDVVWFPSQGIPPL